MVCALVAVIVGAAGWRLGHPPIDARKAFFVAEARAQFRFGSYPTAWSRYRSALALDAKDAALKKEFELVELFYRPAFKGGAPNIDEVEPIAEKALNERSDDARFWLLSGDVRRAQGRITEALHYYREALRRDDRLLSAWVQLGVLEERRGGVDAAMESYREALAVAPYHLCPLWQRARALESTGKLQEAIEEYARVLLLYPDVMRARERVGALLLASGRADEAFESDGILLAALKDYKRYKRYEASSPWAFRLGERHVYLDDLPDKLGFVQCRRALAAAVAGKDQPGTEKDTAGADCRGEPVIDVVENDLLSLAARHPQWRHALAGFRARYT